MFPPGPVSNYYPQMLAAAPIAYSVGKRFYNFYRSKRNNSNNKSNRRSNNNRSRRRRFNPYTNKKINKQRSKLLLPPIEKKIVTRFDGDMASQWTAFAAGATFNYISHLDQISTGSTISTREGNQITVMPYKYVFYVKQPVDTTIQYRVLVIQTIKEYASTTNVNIPTNILAETGSIQEALISSYTQKEDRTITFRILYDKHKYVTSYGNGSGFRKFVIKIPKHNVIYDPDTAGGTVAQGSTHLAVVTDATAANANYTYGTKGIYNFLDM